MPFTNLMLRAEKILQTVTVSDFQRYIWLILTIRFRSEPYPAGDSQGHHSNVGNQSLDNGPARERELYAWLSNGGSSCVIKRVYDSVVNNTFANHTRQLPRDA